MKETLSPHTVEFILSILADKQALLVHCAGFAKGIGSNETNALKYLERLQRAIDRDFELSCSTVFPGDIHTLEIMNYTGKVGLILCPNAMNSITFASPNDAGSQIDPNNPGRRLSGLPPATPQRIQAAIDERPCNAYNELGVLNYSVRGVFIDPPVQYSSEEGIASIECSEVALAFSDQPLFRIHRGELYEVVRGNGGFSIGAKADVEKLYKPWDVSDDP